MSVYIGWMALQAAVVAGLLALVPAAWLDRVFVGQDRRLVLLAFAASFALSQLWTAVTQLGEAIKRTVFVQMVGIIPAVVHLAAVATLAALGRLTVASVLWLMIAEYLAVVVAVGPGLIRANLSSTHDGGSRSEAVRDIFDYVRPLILYTWASFAYTFADRWLLQHYGGSSEQGFFSVGQQLSAVSLLATVAVLRVFWKEVAESFERQDIERTARLYRLTSRAMLVLSAWLCCLLVPFSREVLHWTVGTGYDAAWPAMSLLLVYPAFQTLGQIQGAFFFASSDTRAYALLGVIIAVASLPVTYVLLAPPHGAIAGLGLGAFGVAAKMLGVQVITVQVMAWRIARRNQWRLDTWHSLGVPVVLAALGYLCREAGGRVVGSTGTVMGPGGFMASVGIYAAVTLALLWRWPSLTGFARADLAVFTSRFARLGGLA